MPWCARVCQRAARPSPKHATSNRVFVIRADKGVPARFAIMHAPHQRAPEKGTALYSIIIIPVYAFTMHSEPISVAGPGGGKTCKKFLHYSSYCAFAPK
jgi:hypothetical protein